MPWSYLHYSYSIRRMPRVSAKSAQNDTINYLLHLGQGIRARRKILGHSQEALAGLAGIERAHMGKIERGERNVTILNVLRIAQALECQPSDLLLDAEQLQPDD